MFYVYIIYSDKLQRFYTGSTDNFTRRFEEHNNGKHADSFTLRGIPWILHHLIKCRTSEQAYKIEKHIKSMRSTVYIKNLKIYPEIIERLKERYP
jgi:putative endonuclease